MPKRIHQRCGWDKVGPPPPRTKALGPLRAYENHWFPLIKPYLEGGYVWLGQVNQPWWVVSSKWLGDYANSKGSEKFLFGSEEMYSGIGHTVFFMKPTLHQQYPVLGGSWYQVPWKIWPIKWKVNPPKKESQMGSDGIHSLDLPPLIQDASGKSQGFPLGIPQPSTCNIINRGDEPACCVGEGVLQVINNHGDCKSPKSG